MIRIEFPDGAVLYYPKGGFKVQVLPPGHEYNCLRGEDGHKVHIAADKCSWTARNLTKEQVDLIVAQATVE